MSESPPDSLPPRPSLLITGGAGYIGSHFVRLALQAGHTVLTLDKLTYAGRMENLKDAASHPRHHFVQGDIADIARVESLLREHRIMGVAHFAAETHVDRSIAAPEPFFETNALGTARLLHACRCYWEDLDEADRGAFRFLQVSTDEVYGSLSADSAPVTESAALHPNSPYAASKAAAEHAARAYAHTYGLPVIIARCSNAYGPCQFPEKLIPLMITHALQGKPLPVYGDGSNVRDWIYVTDLCIGLLRVLQDGHVGETYNIGGACEMSNLQLVDMLCGLLDELRPLPHKRYSSLRTFVADRPGHDFRYAMDCRKIQRELGWQVRTRLEEGLKLTVQAHLRTS